jgi:DNA-binding transcriptional ArsR family regulator
MKSHLKINLRTESDDERPDVCDVDFFDVKKIKALRKRMKPDGDVYSLSEVFGVLSDVTRLKIVLAMAETELCVCDLANFLGITKSAVSHHLRLMRNLRLVKFRRDGKMTYYTLDDHHITNLLKQATEHIEEDK